MIGKYTEKTNSLFRFIITLIVSIIFSGCAKNIHSDKLFSTKTPEKKIEQLIKKAEFQLDYFGKKCIPAREQCFEKKQKILHVLDVVENTVSKINVDSSSIEMDDFDNTITYIRNEIYNLGDFSDSIRETKNRVEDLKNELHELQTNIDEIYLVAEDESENAKFSLKKRITRFMVQKKFGMHAKNAFGL
tara:strand:- start:130 stop:696 length:567 start_codon:yes stop_codon:yes gene_type:complete